MTAKIEPLRKPVKCPSCKEQSQRDSYPFCSKRCSDKDLNGWFSDSYTIGSDEINEFEQ